ncbi:Dyp-type peroxidase [Pseudonocardia humida]|uniref:Dyp-type peroxidase n=1 Tax=Pseudonocardia humida TaxID=2800819 RepID=A0ABT1A030_9PSEU|nr:Dyp-type peroxidase domain-containing protein [Pseudonocardia humida]MCO1656355.1 Dyp-type peroxidase [Pseudonocardia humida]
MTLQEGVYHAPGARPGRALVLFFLQAAPGADAATVGAALQRLWNVWRGLVRGAVVDLPGHPVPADALTVLLGYGQKAFTLPGARRAVPAALLTGSFRSPQPMGGGRVVVGSGLSYSPEVRQNPATEEIAVQVVAETQLAVNRVVVETWKATHDGTDPATGVAPLTLTAFYQGFQRADGRSWIDFHDGVSNLRSEERAGVITIKPTGDDEQDWLVGGTYLAFLRLSVDLARWRGIDRAAQELLVGRDKLTGAPITAVGADGPVTVAGCPVAGTTEVIEPGNEAFREPPDVTDPVVDLSHVQRANHHARPASDASSLRIFRQGYEFLEPHGAAPGFRAGLNFVSFQDTPDRVVRILRQPTWLGRTNFGGDPDVDPAAAAALLSVQAGGTYVVPPVDPVEPFPGAGIFA